MSLHDPNVVNSARKKRVAIVIANPARSTATGWPVGFWWSDCTRNRSSTAMHSSGVQGARSLRDEISKRGNSAQPDTATH
jgi:hypothetical protein